MTGKRKRDPHHPVLRPRQGGQKKEDLAIRRALIRSAGFIRREIEREIGRLTTLFGMPDAELRRLGAQAQEVRTMLHRAQKSQISLSYSERIWGSLPEVILEGEETLLACRAIPGDVPSVDVEVE